MECIGLIAGSSGDSLTDKLHKYGYKVALIGGKGNEPGMDKADFVLAIDLDQKECIDKFLKKCSVRFIILGTGHIKAINVAKYLETRGYVFSLNIEKAELAKNKVLFKKEVEKLEVSTPNYIHLENNYNLKEIIKQIGLPCVVKSPIDLLQPQKVSTESELKKAVDEIIYLKSDVLIEKYINGSDCTVPVISDGRTCKSLGVLYYCKAKEYNLKGFEGAYSQKLSNEIEEKLNKEAEGIVCKLGFTGLVRLDYIIENDQSYLLELNSVIVTGYNGSAYPFFKRAGIDVADEMINNAIRIFKLRVKNHE